MIWIFYVLLFLGVALPCWFIGSIWREGHLLEWVWIRSETRRMYVDCCKTTASACAVAASLVSLVVSSRKSISLPLANAVKAGVVLLVIGLVFSTMTIYALSRFYDRAVSRWENDPGRKTDIEQGHLTPFEFHTILILALFSLIGFLEGFAFIGRIAFIFCQFDVRSRIAETVRPRGQVVTDTAQGYSR